MISEDTLEPKLSNANKTENMDLCFIILTLLAIFFSFFFFFIKMNQNEKENTEESFSFSAVFVFGERSIVFVSGCTCCLNMGTNLAKSIPNSWYNFCFIIYLLSYVKKKNCISLVSSSASR